MQILNFTQNLLRQRSFLSSFLLLLTLLIGLGTSQQALAQGPAVDDVGLTFSQKPVGAPSATVVNYAGNGAYDAPYTSYTKLGSANPTPPTSAPDLGTYDISTGTTALALTASSLVAEPLVIRGVTYNPTAARVRYRVYLSGTMAANQPAFTTLTLNNAGPFPAFPAATLFNITTNADLLAGLLGGGPYIIEANFEADYSNGTTQAAAGNTYTATFSVNSPPITPVGGTSTWISTTTTGGSTNWNLAANWSNGVPTRFSDAIIPAKTNPNTVYPVLGGPTTLYEVRNLTLQGQQSSSAAQLTINTATLRVYGDINQPSGGLTGNTTGTDGATDATNNSTLILAGADQIIVGNLLVSDIIVAGSGVKSVINQLTPSNILAFRPSSVANGVILQSAAQDVTNNQITTVFSTTGQSYIGLFASSSISAVSGESETNVSYIKGVTRSDRAVVAGTPNSFGNIGLDITANHSPGTLIVYRVVGDALSGPLATKVPIKRQYKVVGDDNSGNTGYTNSSINVVFHYLNSTDELNGIAEGNLTMFRTVNNGGPYQPLFGTLNTTNKTVTRLTVNSLPNFILVLGDRTNPLPVTLTAFDAKRVGADALVTWQTASEQNNKGYNVQVSNDGSEYRTVGFVASTSANSATASSYSYTDTEKSKTGLRYYRLQQVDLDGKTAYFAPRAVSFDGGSATESAALSAYPNPFSGDVRLNLASVVEGSASVRIADMMGRTVERRTLALTAGNNDLPLADLNNLKGGTYLLYVTLPSGEIKNLKVVKQ